MIDIDRFMENEDTSIALDDVVPVTKEESDRADKLFKSITKEVR